MVFCKTSYFAYIKLYIYNVYFSLDVSENIKNSGITLTSFELPLPLLHLISPLLSCRV